MPRQNLPASAQQVVRVFARACRVLSPMEPGARLLLACSAGGDSMTLLDLAVRAAQRNRWTLAVVHLDHRQRPESAEEALFVAQMAREHGLTAFIEQLSVPDAAASLSEDVMRRARHACWRRAAKAFKADAIALAHQADDLAETFLIRLLAGSGPTGLSGIRPVERLGGLTLVRPLLGARREPMRDYLRARQLAWHDDPSNAALDAQRSWVRHALVPMLRARVGLDPTQRITQAAELIQAESSVLREAISLVLDQIQLEPSPPMLGRIDVSKAPWSMASPLLRRQILREWLWRLRGGAYPPGRGPVEEALAFAQSAAPGAQLRTVEGIHLVHGKTSLMAFPAQVDAATRRAAAGAHLPPPKTSKKKSPFTPHLPIAKEPKQP